MLKMQEHDEHVFYEVGIIETFYRVLESSKKCKFDQIYRYRLRGTNIADFITNYEYDVELTIIKGNKHSIQNTSMRSKITEK